MTKSIQISELCGGLCEPYLQLLGTQDLTSTFTQIINLSKFSLMGKKSTAVISKFGFVIRVSKPPSDASIPKLLYYGL